MIGLGGTGKTQLVLRYIEEHEREYDTVLWIDLRSEKTAWSSYERCCRALCLPVEASNANGRAPDMPCVQAVLSLMRSLEKRWLAVVDNADNMSWDAHALVPKSTAGTVIVTRRNLQVSQLLGRRTTTVQVGAMEPEEAICLVLNNLGDWARQEDGCCRLVEEITKSVGRLALPMDLAAARIRVDVENGADLAAVLRQYLSDYQHNHDKLLLDQGFASASTYRKTVWTVWETSLSSLREVEDDRSDIYPIQLLNFMTLLDRAGVQDELFRLASLGLDESCSRLDVRVPAWMRDVLGKGEDDEWNDSSYRATIRVLWRYGLVRPVGEPWRGITMHSVVRRQAGVGVERAQYWCWYLVFVGAVCVQSEKEADKAYFRQHLLMHLPSNDDLLGEEMELDAKGLWWVWSTIGHTLWKEGKWRAAEELVVKVIEASSRVLGEEHPDTISAMANLATTYCSQGRWKEAEELDVKVLVSSSRVLGEDHPDTITAMDNLAATYGSQGRSKESEELETEVMEARMRVLGYEHTDTITAMANLAATYWLQGRWKETEGLDVKVLEARTIALGGEHPDTIRAMSNLAVTYRNQGRPKEAEELEAKVMEVRMRVLSENFSKTIKAMAKLAKIQKDLDEDDRATELTRS